MTCSQCRCEFCWICFKEYPSHSSFLHSLKIILVLLAFFLTLFCLFMLPPVNKWVRFTLVPNFPKLMSSSGKVIRWIICYIAAVIISVFVSNSIMALYDKLLKKPSPTTMSIKEIVARFIISYCISYSMFRCLDIYDGMFEKLWKSIFLGMFQPPESKVLTCLNIPLNFFAAQCYR